jgi:hypothetical protein
MNKEKIAISNSVQNLTRSTAAYSWPNSVAPHPDAEKQDRVLEVFAGILQTNSAWSPYQLIIAGRLSILTIASEDTIQTLLTDGWTFIKHTTSGDVETPSPHSVVLQQQQAAMLSMAVKLGLQSNTVTQDPKTRRNQAAARPAGLSQIGQAKDGGTDWVAMAAERKKGKGAEK